MTKLSILLTVLLTVIGFSRTAEACACCDGSSVRKVLGWQGGQLAVELERHRGCAPSAAVEIYQPMRSSPTRCLDLLRGGSQAACSALAGDWKANKAPVPLAFRKLTARSVSPRHLRARLRLNRTDPAAHEMLIEVEVRNGSRWERIYDNPIIPYLDGSPIEDMDPAIEIRGLDVMLLPVPDQPKRAALFIDGEETSPGDGHRDSRIAWVKLPRALPTVKWQRSVPTIVMPDATNPRLNAPLSRVRKAAATLNSRGMEAHRRSGFREAAKLFSQALHWDSRHVLARYNLACALARLGYPERAIEQLELAIDTAPAQVAAQRRRRARVDPDLRTLRHLAGFRRLVSP